MSRLSAEELENVLRWSSPQEQPDTMRDMAEEIIELRSMVDSLWSLVHNAETIIIQSSTNTPFKPKMVHASDIEDVLTGRSR